MKLLLIMLLPLAAMAQFSAEDARIRLMPPGWKSTAAFVNLKNSGDQPLEIVAATAEFAKTVELHTHKIEEGVMRMRKVDKMVIPAKGELILKPHSDHLMFFDVKEELKEGDKHVISLEFADGQKKQVEFEVKKINSKKSKHKH